MDSKLTARTVDPSFDARAAVTPAACPIAMQLALTRTEPCASWEVEMQRPATSTLVSPRGSRQRSGTW